MSSVNKVIILGYLGRDPEVRYAPNGNAVATFSVATSRSWKSKESGEKQEETEWHRCVAYQRLGEIVGEYLKKGSHAYFEGHLKTRKWENKEGVTMYTTEIIVDTMMMISNPDREERPASQRAPAPSKSKGRTGFDDMDSDIPF